MSRPGIDIDGHSIGPNLTAGKTAWTGTDPVPRRGAQDWRGDAACRDSDPNLFHPPSGALSAAVGAAAKAVCAGCPVRQQCLDDAIANREPTGIWGGLTTRERKALAAEHAALACPHCDRRFASTQGLSQHLTLIHDTTPSAECGTYAGFYRHRRAGERPCDACRAAYNAYQREIRRRRREGAA